jgi:hypothetical protein
MFWNIVVTNEESKVALNLDVFYLIKNDIYLFVGFMFPEHKLWEGQKEQVHKPVGTFSTACVQ